MYTMRNEYVQPNLLILIDYVYTASLIEFNNIRSYKNGQSRLFL